jgi:hypothetical protein
MRSEFIKEVQMKVIKENDFTSDTKVYFEHNIAIGGYTYLVIFGRHINGGFICVPNWKWGCEASDLQYSSGYNKEKLMAAGANEEVAEQIARYIEEWLEEN